jgi:hypothetical protein
LAGRLRLHDLQIQLLGAQTGEQRGIPGGDQQPALAPGDVEDLGVVVTPQVVHHQQGAAPGEGLGKLRLAVPGRGHRGLGHPQPLQQPSLQRFQGRLLPQLHPEDAVREGAPHFLFMGGGDGQHRLADPAHALHPDRRATPAAGAGDSQALTGAFQQMPLEPVELPGAGDEVGSLRRYPVQGGEHGGLRRRGQDAALAQGPLRQ